MMKNLKSVNTAAECRVRSTKHNLEASLLDELLDMQKLQTFALDSVRLERMFTNGMVCSREHGNPLATQPQRRVEDILQDGIEKLFS